MIVSMYMDPHGYIDKSPDDEYAEIEVYLKKIFRLKKIFFKREVQPYALSQQSCDLYIFDVGGMGCMPGYHAVTDDYLRKLIEQVQEKPDTLFVLWSAFTGKFFRGIIRDEFPEFLAPPNVLTRYQETFGDMDNEFEPRLRAWFAPATK